jgi:hypothetical protein
VKVWTGFVSLLNEPSPKFQVYALISPVDWLVNCTVSGAMPEVGVRLNSAFGGGLTGFSTTTCRRAIEVPPGPVTVRNTLYVPTPVKVWLGLRSVLVVPSLKFHNRFVMLPDDWSVNCMVSGAGPLALLCENPAMGALAVRTLICQEKLDEPPGPVTVSVTV